MIWWCLLALAGAADDRPTVDLAEEAELRFRMGVAAYRAGEFEQALEHLLLSHRLVPNRNVVFNLARAYEQLDRFDQAYRHYAELVRTETDPGAVAEAQESMARIVGEVARVEIVSDPPGASVYVERVDLGSRGTTPLTLALPEGQHTLLVERTGWTPMEMSVALTAGEVNPVSFALRPIAVSPGALEHAEAAPAFELAQVRVPGAVLLSISDDDCRALPGTVDGAGRRAGPLLGVPYGSAAASATDVQGLVVDWTLPGGQVWRAALPRADKKALWLQDGSPLHGLLAGCALDAAAAEALGGALAGVDKAWRRDVVAFFGEWAAVGGSGVTGDVLEGCRKGDCSALADLLRAP